MQKYSLYLGSQQPEIGNTDFQQASKPLLLTNPVTSPPPQWAESPTNKPKQFEAPSNSNPGSWSNSVNSGGNQKMWAKTEGLGGFSKGSSPVDNLVVVQTTQHPEVQRPAQVALFNFFIDYKPVLKTFLLF